MKILVCIKRVVDYNVRIRVKADESGVELANIKMAMNPFDDIAVEEAIRLKEKGAASEIIVAAIGAEAVQEQLRTALAMGADRAVRIACDTEVDSLGAAKLYAALARREEPGLILLGKQAIDDDACACGQMLAALLGWPQGTFASKIAVENGGVNVTREVDDGLVTLSLALPAVVTADLRLNEPRYPSLPNIMKAKSKPLTVVTAEKLAPGNTAPRLSILKTQAPPKRQAGIRVKDTVELVEKLKAAGVV